MPEETRLVAIDPGLRECGVAEFLDGELTRCDAIVCHHGEGPVQWVATADALAEWIGDVIVDELAIEYMVTRRGRRDAHDALIQLSQVSGATYSMVRADASSAIKPAEWTKSRPKKVNHRRVRKRLDDDETAALTAGLKRAPKANAKEVLDAVGIGLFVLNRL